MPDGNVKLVGIDFSRTRVRADISTHIRYTMKKVTSVGLLEASKTVTVEQFRKEGADAVDGKMFFCLGEALNREEMNRILEMGANMRFGHEAA